MKKLLACYEIFFCISCFCVLVALSIYLLTNLLVGLYYLSTLIGAEYGSGWMQTFVCFLIINGVFIPLIWMSGITEEI